jgi:hypothetical protein
MGSDEVRDVTRRDFLRGSGGMAAAAMLGGVVLAGCTSQHSPAPYRHWSQKRKGGLTDAEYIAMCGTLAASPHNTQPWRFQLQGETIQVFADRQRHLGHGDPEHRLMLMSIGCALENMSVAAGRLGFEAAIDIDAARRFDGDGHCATMRLRRAAAVTEHPWFDAMFVRQTTRSDFAPLGAVAERYCRAVDSQCDLPGIAVRWYEGAAAAPIRALTGESVRAYVNDDARQRDSMQWFRITRREWEAQRDGVAIFTSDAPAPIKRWVELFGTRDDLTSAKFREGEIEVVDRLAQATPLWGVIYADRAHHDTRVHAGRMAERVYLETAARGLAIQPLNYPTEIPGVAARLKAALAIPPQSELLFVFRVGRAPYLERSVRRSLIDVLV